jgi:type VI secretion system protein ImpF
MARWEPEQTVTQSLLERLIDRDLSLATDPVPTRAASVRQLKASLRRDLEWLLNTRRTPTPASSEFAQTEKSLFNFGLPDVTSLSWESSRDRARLSRLIEETVAIFEPRITGLKVVALESTGGAQHVLRFQIQGLLDMDPAPEHISFDTVLQLSSGEYQIRGDGGA